MVRYGTVSVGVALEQETTSYHSCANSDSSHPLLNSSGTSLLYDPNSSASVTTHHQSLRITFAYQAASRTMSDVIITLSDHDQQLTQTGTLTALERGALMAQSKTDPNNPFYDENKEIQVYSVETVKGKGGGLVKNGKVYIEEIPVTPTPGQKAICDSESNSTEVILVNKPQENDENNNETVKTKDSVDGTEEKESGKANSTEQKQEKKDNQKDNKKNKAKAGDSEASESSVKGEESQGKEDKGKIKPRRPINKCRPKDKSDKQAGLAAVRERRARSMSKSRIPIINSAAHEYYPCEYYRRKLMCDHGVCDYHTCWLNFPAIQKSAGQKVVKKITAQQKKLEEDAATNKKKVEFMLDEDEHPTKPLKALIPMRKRPSRLDPILVRRNK